MNKLSVAAIAAATVALAACGSTTSASTTTPAAATPSGAGARGAAGEVAQITGSQLIINAATGDITVLFTGTTIVQRTRTGSLADLTVGTCVAVTGSKDATGAVTAAAIRTFTATSTSCTLTGNGFGTRSPGAVPRPSGSPARPPNANFALTVGAVTAAAAGTITVQTTAGPSTITVPTTARISLVTTATDGDISVGDCVTATGPRTSSGTVTARTITIVPSGANGCSTRAGGGFGGGFGGGGFGAAPAPAA
jgi:hypothetical protein